MKKFQTLIILLLSVIMMAGCSSDRYESIKKQNGPKFVKSVADLLNTRTDAPELYNSEANPWIDFENGPAFEPYFFIKDMKTTEDPEDKALVHYTCKIPGLVGTVYNMVFGEYFINNEKYSPWVEIEGDLRILTDDKGKHSIDISDPDHVNVFGTYAALRYTAPAVFAEDPVFQRVGKLHPEGISKKDVSKGLSYIPVLTHKFCSLYSSLTGVTPEEYTKNIIAPELKYYTENFSEVSKRTNKAGYGLMNWHNALPWYLMIPLDLVLLIIFFVLLFMIFMKISDLISPTENRNGLRKKWKEHIKNLDREQKKRIKNKNYKIILANSKFTDYKENERKKAIQNLTYPEDREMLLFLAEEDDINLTSLNKLPYPEEQETLVKLIKKIQDDEILHNSRSEIELAIIEKLPYPAEKEVLEKEAKGANLAKVRQAALQKLAYPVSKDVIEYIAVSDSKPDVRLAAIEKISYPESETIMEKAILSDACYKEYQRLKEEKQHGKQVSEALQRMEGEKNCCLAILRKLPYPEAKESLARIARNSCYFDVRGRALEKLQFPADRKVIMDCLMNQNYYGHDTDVVIGRMQYPADREDLIEMAKGAPNYDAREAAIKLLPYTEEKETFSYILEHDEEGFLRDTIMKKIASSDDGQAMLAETALKAADDETRLDALKKLDFAKNRKVFQQAAQKDKEGTNRRYAIEKLEFPEDRKALAKTAQSDSDRENRFLARRKLPFLEEPSAWAHEDLFGDGKTRYIESKLNATDTEKVKGAIALTLSPRDNKQILRNLCRLIQKSMNSDSKSLELTLAGWAAAALGKVLTAEMTPDDIEPNRKCFEKAIDKYNKVVKKIQDVQGRLFIFGSLDTRYLTESQKKDYEEFKSLREELDRGLGDYMLDNGDKPFTYLTHILRDNQSRVPRFIKQGVIMGLLDWLMTNREHPEAKKLLEDVITVRADLIRSDNKLSFFEVRVPADCTRDEYAKILSMVLKTANPSIRYCSTQNLLKLAEEEVPGCMNMLQKYPLRLIDPVNAQTLGFYEFKPYIHEMWTQYQPPLNTGKVISRYHEVDDRTLPLSAGLNLQLFRDTYSVIPTIFHEYQHFDGDPNEASVFLKTQFFSIGFYKRHPNAKASRDAVFATLSEMMGMPPAPSKRGALNELIQKYYGKEVSPAEAIEHANAEIKHLNDVIYTINVRQTWDPSVTFPQLTDGEDKKDRDLIRDIIIRWDKTPKSITADEFRAIAESIQSPEEEEAQYRPD